ncbi:peptide-N4-asparagine amidase [Fulvimonas yonginensis]|uniref:Peptide-N4-asparagine amidase n=1 Tax=Fulvimonas yonginensis TaxID=1495200 RepID=A0ABU8J8W5_9GAMM
MSTDCWRQRLTQAALSTTALVLLAPCVAAASPLDVTIERAAPPVPVPRSAPCEVRLFSDAPFKDPPTSYTFAPPVSCPPPWSKVVLSMDLSGANAEEGIAVALNGVTVFIGPTPSTPVTSHWHVERDLTDYSALFKMPASGTLTGLQPFRGGLGNQPATGTATLRFYPPTAAQPAPRVPDAVYSAYTALLPPYLVQGGPSGAIKELASLPHNIERAYLDVTANDFPFWYTCLTESIYQAHPSLWSRIGLGLARRGIWPVEQGCLPHGYADAGVTVDGTPAGVAPSFPWLPTHFSINSGPVRSVFWNALDVPTDSAQSLDYTPWRVDLTPFAAVLNEAGTHQIALDMPNRVDSNGAWFLAPRNANLLVYLDHGKKHLNGAVTYNSLSRTRPDPAIESNFGQDGGVLTGHIETRFGRDFKICGYVDTSHGRIRTDVSQQSLFRNVQTFRVYESPYGSATQSTYEEDVALMSTVQTTSRRIGNGTLLAEDRHTASYPLTLDYLGRGRWTDWYHDPEDQAFDLDLFGGSVSAHQQRREEHSHSRRGLPDYHAYLSEEFYGSHTVDPYTQASSDWHAAHAFAFQDNRGSCYQKVVTTQNGRPEDVATGTSCPNGQNRVRWFAHPDGSAEGLGWMNP